jgi:hypothetical protein
VGIEEMNELPDADSADILTEAPARRQGFLFVEAHQSPA